MACKPRSNQRGKRLPDYERLLQPDQAVDPGCRRVLVDYFLVNPMHDGEQHER